MFAVALFEKFEGTPPPAIDDFTFDLYWTGANTKFAFDTPSPDDKFAKAQSDIWARVTAEVGAKK